MWTRRISSETQEYPKPADVIRKLLSRMRERGIESSWAHFEVVAEGGWLLSGLDEGIRRGISGVQTDTSTNPFVEVPC